MNTQAQIERFEVFREGWRRKSAMMLDYCGLSSLLIWWRCWGLTDAEYNELWDWYNDTEPGQPKSLLFDYPQPPVDLQRARDG